MAARRTVKAGLVVAGALFALLLLLSVNESLSEDELARRVAQSQPSWNNYDEDLKAQLGAAPVAQWEGSLSGIQWEPGVVRVSFSLRGDWAERDAAIPVLVKLPTGETMRHESALRAGGQVEYRFPSSCDIPPRWVRVRYPFYGERRIVLSEEGCWEATGG